MYSNNLLVIYLTLEWLIAAYIGVLVRNITMWYVRGTVQTNVVNLAAETVWVTLSVPFIVRKWPELWQQMPRTAQWLIAFLIGFGGTELQLRWLN